MTSFGIDRHTEEERQRRQAVYRYIIESFPRLGRAPSLKEAAEDLDLSEGSVLHTVGALEEDGLVKSDPGSSWIADAYPYSARRTDHTVTLESGTDVFCMCAIDCFYVPFLGSPDLTIRSRCHFCGRSIRIRIERQNLRTVEPAATVIWDSAASYDCPQTNFFCETAHLEQWREREPDALGRICSVEEGLRRGAVGAAHIWEVLGEEHGPENEE